ncbi:MAG: hypothetical protein HQ512_06135 [Rhodospirillales bacterium]|nr:hypothetical protein [Rhodospirillales bacterium]
MTFPRLTFQTLAVFSAISVLLSVALMAARIATAVSFSEPLQLTTSGWEQETLYPIWKALNGHVVYPDPYKIPFAATFYNWLFIEAYAVFSGAVLSIFSLADAWLPTAGRFLTLGFLFIGTALSYATFLLFLNPPDRPMKILCLSFAAAIFFGTLVGFWGFTVRADIGALLFEILGVYVFWKFYPSRPYRAVLLFAIAAYCAWGFKQVDIVSNVAVGFFLLYRRDWKPLFLLICVLLAAYLATFAIGGPLYIRGFYESSRLGYSLAQFAVNISNFALKASPFLAALGALALAGAASPRWRRAWLADDKSVFALIGLGSAMAINFLISTKVGSADNYYFVLSFFIALATLKGYDLIREDIETGESQIPLKGALGISTLGWATNIAAVAAVFIGIKGIVSVAPQHEFYSTIKNCAAKLPKPVFVDNAYLSLPWMSPGEHHFVVSYSYPMDRGLGLPFEKGGIGGMIREGYFSSLLLHEKNKGVYDGATLDGYKKQAAPCRSFVPYIRVK